MDKIRAKAMVVPSLLLAVLAASAALPASAPAAPRTPSVAPAATRVAKAIAAAATIRLAAVPVAAKPVALRPATIVKAKTVAPVYAALAPRPAALSGTGRREAEQHLARRVLGQLIRQHPILAGVTVSIGETPRGYEAVAYYQSGRILIDTDHTVGIPELLRHEIWHIIDWRDNGRIDWGENVPPRR